jgi:hypothetical protein
MRFGHRPPLILEAVEAFSQLIYVSSANIGYDSDSVEEYGRRVNTQRARKVPDPLDSRRALFVILEGTDGWLYCSI